MTAPADHPSDIADDNAAPALSRQFAEVSHSLRASMNGIAGMLAMLRERDLSASQQQYATILQNKLDTLLDMIERMVDMSLLEANQFTLTHSQFDLRTEIEASCSHKIASARAKGLTLTLDCPPSVLLEGDPARLRQLVSMLVDGAIRFTEQGEITVSARAECARHSCEVHFDVHAHALSEVGERLNAMLSQDASASPRSTAALELALCVQLAKLLGGRISISNPPEQGTIFHLSLSLPLAMNRASGVRTLLVAEPSVERDALEEYLGEHGLRVEAFDGAMDALNALTLASAGEDPFRFAVIDRWIGAMDGELLGTSIKADRAHANMVLALLSERAQHDQQILEQSGFSALLVRSAPRSELDAALSCLRAALEEGRTPRFISAGAVTHPGQHDNRNLPFAGRRILLAEDNPVNQQIALRMLETLGCVTDTAEDGQQAVDKLRATDYDLVLMDCEMPGMDGYQATRMIRASQGSSKRTPVVALTASSSQDEREKCIACGMDDFLSKPIRPQQVKGTLARWLGQASVDAPRAQPSALLDELDAMHAAFGENFREITNLYRNDSPPRIAALREACGCDDRARMGKIAHALGGSSASIGATRLSILCRELEMRAKSGTMDDAEQRIHAIETEYHRINSKLQSLLP
ncbi:MAG TPA: response regulator [Noviherbaspirillum sp.]|uniref:response regulator n=1 Tax=Noviherbaspirillum sp. TaxID=1926288 RepID=UPI002B48C194|nr:response regulator [Noviherbaspirillum sp.]HJV85900.1 response regulator [Noviherbaspirillum sp.]